MSKSLLMLSAAFGALAAPAYAQDATAASQPQAAASETMANRATQDAGQGTGDIIVTATRRNEALSDVPLAVSAVTAQSLANSGASDIRQLNQLSPSLLVSSSSSEAGAGGARIRGVGTVGDNPGLESSVATFIDGVYRNRAAVGLTELGAIDRIEVLRGPQGTLFGRNASAGLISIITAKPSFTFGAQGEASYGNYNAYRVSGGITGPVSEQIALRLDGVYSKRDGFLTDVVSGRTVNNRDRYLLRGQILFQPSADLSVRIIGDYAQRKEECCTAPFLPAQTVSSSTPDVGGGNLIFSPSGIKTLETALGGPGTIQDNTYARTVSISPGRSFRSDVRDYGVSGEINYTIGSATLTSITAYRDFRFIRGQDADFNSLDILYRADDGSAYTRFKTFTQELRLQGTAFGDKLNYLVGGYFADEKLTLADNLSYGSDADRYAAGVVNASVPGFGSFGYPNLRSFTAAFLQGRNPAFTPAVTAPVTALVPNFALAGSTTRDVFRQDSRNYALFTHDIFNITDRLSLTLGARYTNERKTLDATLQSSSNCATLVGGIGALQAYAASATNPAALKAAASGAASLLSKLTGLPCALNSVNGSYAGGYKSEERVTGTAVLSYKATDRLLTYASYSRGYKAGGFNLDRAGLTYGNVDLNALQFAPEIVDAYEIGAKFKTRGFNLNVAAFRQDFSNFQLNTFNGINFVVENVGSCSVSPERGRHRRQHGRGAMHRQPSRGRAFAGRRARSVPAPVAYRHRQHRRDLCRHQIPQRSGRGGGQCDHPAAVPVAGQPPVQLVGVRRHRFGRLDARHRHFGTDRPCLWRLPLPERDQHRVRPRSGKAPAGVCRRQCPHRHSRRTAALGPRTLGTEPARYQLPAGGVRRAAAGFGHDGGGTAVRPDVDAALWCLPGRTPALTA